MAPLMDSTEIYDQVGKHYGAAARSKGDDGSYASRVASAFGYTQADLQDMPEDANLGLSCGNPIALANLREGETVCDLGSGAGFDVFQAAKKVGSSGKAIGVDFNKDMLQRAENIKSKTGVNNAVFVESPITTIALPDSSVDCIISNCVINLIPESEKQLVFNEMFRLLKSGGRVAVSDILAKGDLPEHIRNDMALYVGCIAGASQVGAYEKYLHAAGFNDVLIVDAKSDLNVYWSEGGASGPCGGPSSSCCGPTPAEAPEKSESCCKPTPAKKTEEKGSSCCAPKTSSTTPQASKDVNIDYNEFAGSFKIFAIKP